ncbi:hypothetical protein PVL29_004758 [Vitis rotundifolia]|uniref:Disease resistance RPP13-like protein 1 n=1 Tax=Vitis rotundifolia TaxID=103349 RepID=A0AA39E015_VITRO|nr:hypothetical protein PVL29_004758 [Vitis rotundifolia]
MAEGFLQQLENKKTMEEVGDGYFYDLLSRSFFQKSSSHKSYFVMHDLINDLAQLVFGKFCVQLKDGNMNENPKKLRHLSYFRSDYDRFERFETLSKVNSLRTFLPLNLGIWPQLDKVSNNGNPPGYGRYILKFHLSNRVIVLCYYRILELSYSIGNLKHLCYLDLTYTPIKRLPESIYGLYNLQILILYNCECLIELPKVMCKLISLRHLDIRQSPVKEMPSQMGQLKSLQKLSNYIVTKQSGTRVGELRELSHIRGSLVIEKMQNVVDAKDASEANLVGKQYLDELQLVWSHDSGIERNGEDIVLNNLQPHSNLKRLSIYGYGGSRFPDWLGGPSILNMVSLRLWDCQNVSAFPPLGQLPSLKHLYICGLMRIERVGVEFYGTDSFSTRPSFPSLKALSIRDMPNWKEWLCLGDQSGEFPRLKKLCIEHCPKLIGDLPNHLPLLKKLEIERWEQLVAPSPRVPAIGELKTRNCDISQWKELPPLLRHLSITNSDSLESLLEEGMLQSNTSLQTLRIINCTFSRPLCRICLPITLKLLDIFESEELEFLLPELFKCHLPFLAWLYILGCTCNSFLSFPLGHFPRLSSVIIQDLKGLESLSISISDGDLTSLNRLDIDRCPNLVSIELSAHI